MEDIKILENLLRALTPRFDHIIVALEESKHLDFMIVEELHNSMEAHEQRVIDRKNSEKLLGKE